VFWCTVKGIRKMWYYQYFSTNCNQLRDMNMVLNNKWSITPYEHYCTSDHFFHRESVHMWYQNGCMCSDLETKHHAKELFVMNCYNSILISVVLPECSGQRLQQKVKMAINPFMNANMHLYIICHIKNSECGYRENFTDSLEFKITTTGLNIWYKFSFSFSDSAFFKHLFYCKY